MQIYVSGNVLRSGDGSVEHPFKTIQEAALIAQAGDTVLVAPGIYREWVKPVNSGTESDRIKYVSTSRGEAVITGAERLSGWEAFENVWRIRIPNSFFGDYNPYTDEVHGDWFWTSDKNPHTGDIYLDGRSMYEVFDLSLCMHPQKDRRSWDADFSQYVWYTAQEDGSTVIYANFQGKDPNEENVEFSVRKACFYPEKTGLNYITLCGFTVRCAATQWAPPTALQEGMIGPHWAKGWIIEDCDIYESKCCGISLGKYYQKGNNNKWSTNYVKIGSQTERDAICQAVNEGWDKETVGSHIVRRCDIHDCGQTGIVGHLGGAFSIIEDNHIHNINNKHNLAGAEIGGIKLHAAIDAIIRRNHIDHCTRGLWLDWQAQGTRVSQNLFHDNVPPEGTVIEDGLSLGEDIFIEVSHGPTLIDHNLLLSDIACRLSTQGLAFVHNLIAGSFTYVGLGTDDGTKKFPTQRFTPYHVPHSTKIAGFMTILHGDARFYNNIFVQKKVRQDLLDFCVSQNSDTMDMNNFICGTCVYNHFPTPSEYFSRFKKGAIKEAGSTDMYYDHLPVYTGGNAFYNGARASDYEVAAHVDQDHKISLYLDEEDGRYTLHTNLYEYLPRNFTLPVNTESLGVAFEPEQRFENPDGSAIMFDTDYFGRKRGRYPVAGPFEECNTDRFTVQTPGFGSYRIRHDESPRLEGKEEAKKDAEAKEEESFFEEMDPSKEFETNYDHEAKEPNFTMKEDVPEPEDIVSEVNANILLTGCESAGISFPFEGSLFQVRDMFVKGNEVWLYDGVNDKVVELDCEYGIYHTLKKWSIGALQSIDVSDDPNCEGFVRTAGTLLCILNKSMAHDPADTCATIQEKVNSGIEHKGIKMRFTTKYLKFIRNKKFISLEDVIYRMSKGNMDIVTERLEKL
ncbi:right-handed parallel beta-helix repeat-containing protein [Butyrivibrio sp. AE2032]|uniref:right-handed parallel beta-helix repeat-containing protein n=1 Tax=Butyrivibrio sp. AE2032 TaxID=1458463 RepID=UPI000830C440|nr:right-handed parallel beta-helix repeat-containing protein [Butyrivibrio sp. AE2032]